MALLYRVVADIPELTARAGDVLVLQASGVRLVHALSLEAVAPWLASDAVSPVFAEDGVMPATPQPPSPPLDRPQLHLA